MILEIEHRGENAENASLSLEVALDRAVEAAVVRWRFYQPDIAGFEEVEESLE
jgi:hypothetical protein